VILILKLLHLAQMQIEVIGVLKPFLAFASSFQPCHVYNMTVFMLDTCFKNLQLIKDYVGLELAMQVVVDYDQEILMPFLLAIYHALTPNLTTITSITSIMVELGVFGSLTFTKEVVMGFIRTKLSFLKRTTMLIDPFNPFTWWAEHEQQFPNLILLA
jgi:hypothetical protein